MNRGRFDPGGEVIEAHPRGHPPRLEPIEARSAALIAFAATLDAPKLAELWLQLDVHRRASLINVAQALAELGPLPANDGLELVDFAAMPLEPAL